MTRRDQTCECERLGLIIPLLTVVLVAACEKLGPAQPGGSGSTSTATSGSAARSGGAFEGIVTLKVNSEGAQEIGMTYFIKGQKTRIEVSVPGAPEGEAASIYDLDNAKIISLMPSRKMYMTMDLKQAGEGLKDAAKEWKEPSGAKEPITFPTLTPTGKQETIAGYQCEHWLMGADKQEIDMCVAKGLGYFGMGGQMGSALGSLKNLSLFDPKAAGAAAAHPEWVKFLEGGAFPLKLIALENGQPKWSMEATKVERKSLDDSLFTIPPGYTELNLQNMMRGKQ